MNPDRTESHPLASLTSRLPAVDDLTNAQWGRVGAGAALALAGTGLVSLGTLVRLAAVIGGGAMVYRTLNSAAPRDGDAREPKATAWSARPSLYTGDPDANGASMEGTEAPTTAVDLGRS